MTMNSITLDKPAYDVTQLHALQLPQLTQLKTAIELYLSKLFDQLNQHGVDLNSSLLTKGGFPRNDIDIVQVRLLRVEIIRTRNDLKTLLNLIDTKLQDHFTATTTASSTVTTGVTDNSISKDTKGLLPFVKVGHVVEGSPADRAGLQVDDLILQFGSLNITNFQNLLQIKDVVMGNKNQEVGIIVKNIQEKRKLILVPTDNWNGQGLLGCKLDKL